MALALLLFGVAVAFIVGFGWFIWRMPFNEVELKRGADGIVVLTGGAERISDAVDLLATGRGKRLLITGVNRSTTLSEIARLVPSQEKYVTCCVDLDYSALNTVGNATETRRWVDSRGFRSLIVVTSTYHMRRALSELGRQMPDVELIPFPVVSERMRSEDWWSSPEAARLLVTEYLKFLFAQLRIMLEPLIGI
jgi:uncharacterized SAM-binding protein YcdF (DUF218 family)